LPCKNRFRSSTWDGAPIRIPYVAVYGNQQRITANFTDYGDERLKANFDINSYPSRNQTILMAMKKYGLMLADIGSNMYISGAPDEKWNNDELRELPEVKASDLKW